MEEEQEAYKLRKLREDGQKEDFCCQICMESFDEDGEDDQTMPFCLQQCENIFHADCLVSYLET